MATQVTSGGGPQQARGARVLVRNSSGTPYVVVENITEESIQVWKGNSTTPTSFTQQDTSNNPDATVYGSASCAIDSSDILHIAYMHDNGKSSDMRYVTFNADGTTDTFSGDVSVDSDIGADPTSIGNLYTAIAIDSNDIPHIAYTRYDANMGTDYWTLTYNNRIGGAWNGSGTEVEGATAEKNCRHQDMCIDETNVPVISYLNGTDSDLTRAVGDANDPSSFTLTDLDTAMWSSGQTSVCVDSDGTIWCAGKDSDNSIILYEDTTARDTGSSGNTPSLVANGTDIYVFYEDSNNDIAYDKWNGSSFDGATVVETGTYDTLKAKWAFWVDNDSTGAIYTNNTYYFDGTPSDPGGSWSNDSNATDGSDSTSASTTTDGFWNADYLESIGTTAPSSGDTIVAVLARFKASIVYVAGSVSCAVRIYNETPGATNELYSDTVSSTSGNLTETTEWAEVSTPLGGWTWTDIDNLRFRGWGNTDTVGEQADIFIVEIKILTKSSPSELDYTFDDGTNIQWNTLDLASFAPDQDLFRFYEDGTESGSSPIDTEGTDISRNVDSDSNLHLRVRIQETGGLDGATTDDWQLRYSKNSGAYANVTTSSSDVKGFASASTTDGGATTNRASNGITDGTGTFVAGEVSEDGLIDDMQLTADNFTEVLYTLTLVSADLNNNDTLDFQIQLNGADITFTDTPRITATKTVTFIPKVMIY